jgi:hypothetical protein
MRTLLRKRQVQLFGGLLGLALISSTCTLPVPHSI